MNKNSFLGDFFVQMKDKFIQLIDIREDTDQQGTIASIEKYSELNGFNVWILLAAAMIASMGLDLNSSAVIIGAMLVSPLMSPILGVGLSFGINDRNLLNISLKSLAIAVSVSILTSYFYFSITPLGLLTDELLARTQPTLIDAGVAFFGGVAGIVAGSHKDKTNALPGVAIATALMPPLCTVGFGLAIGDMAIWMGAFYLFFINAVIISATTFFFVRLLDFPVKERFSVGSKQQIIRNAILLVLLAIIPSIFILFSTIKRVKANNNIETFITKHIDANGREVLQWERNDFESFDELKLYVVGESFPEDSTQALQKALNKMPELTTTYLNVIQINLSQRDKFRMASELSSGITRDIMLEVSEQLRLQESDQFNKQAVLERQIQELEATTRTLQEQLQGTNTYTKNTVAANLVSSFMPTTTKVEEKNDTKKSKKEKKKEAEKEKEIPKTKSELLAEKYEDESINKLEKRLNQLEPAAFVRVQSPNEGQVCYTYVKFQFSTPLAHPSKLKLIRKGSGFKSQEVFSTTDLPKFAKEQTVNFVPDADFPKGLYYWELESEEEVDGKKVIGKFYRE